MRVHADSGAAGILVDLGTGRRIPFAVWFDTETGDYEAHEATADGRSMLAAEDCVTPLGTFRGRAVGQLKLVPMENAKLLGATPTPRAKRVEKAEGLERYKRVYFEVWQFRGEAKRTATSRWADYLLRDGFLDDLVIRRKHAVAGS